MFTLDYASRSVLAVCTCGWRHLSTSAAGARRAAAEHEQIAHPGQYHAAKMIDSATRRHAGRVSTTRKSRQ